MPPSTPPLESLREAWEPLAAACRSPLVGHDWVLSCVEAFDLAPVLRLVVTSSGGAVTGIAPLVRLGGRLVAIGSARLFEPTDWLAGSPTAVAELADRVAALGEPLVLERVPVTSPAVAALAALPRRRVLTARRAAAPSLAVPTSGDWSAYHDGLTSHIRVNLARLRRKAEREFGPVSFHAVAPGVADVAGHLETFVAVEGSGWKHQRGSALRDRADLRDFFLRYCRRRAAAGALRVHTMTIGDRVAAVELADIAYDRHWQLKIGYADALSKFYPGLQLTQASLRRAFDERREAYEFLGSAESWERQWQPEQRAYATMIAYPTTVRGLKAGGADALRMAARRLRRVAGGA